MGWLCRRPGRAWESIRKRAHTQLVRLAEQLWTDPGLKSGNSLSELILSLKKKSAGGEWIVEHSPKILAREEKVTTPPLPRMYHACNRKTRPYQILFKAIVYSRSWVRKLVKYCVTVFVFVAYESILCAPDVVKMHYFVNTFLCAMYECSLFHSFIHVFIDRSCVWLYCQWSGWRFGRVTKP